MPGIVDVAGVEVFGKGRGEYELPCGCVDEAGKVHKKIVFREITGHEEDAMDDDAVPRHKRVTEVLAACTESIGPITDKEKLRQIISDEVVAGKGITSTDRIASMIFLRRCSVGDVYKFDRRCPRCGHINKGQTLDLREVKMTTVPDDRVAKRRVEIVLPRTQKKVVLRVMTAKHEDGLAKLKPTSKDLRSAAMSARVESIDGAKLDNPRVAVEMLKDLPEMDRVYIRQVYDMIEADVDTSVEITCASVVCGAEFSFPLDLGQSFFSNAGDAGATEKGLKWL